MENLSRFRNALSFKKVDRLPMMEWAGWWDLTLDRWHSEGLPSDIKEVTDVAAYLGMDVHKQFWLDQRGNLPPATLHGHCLMSENTIECYKETRKLLRTPKEVVAELDPQIEFWVKQQSQGKAFVWITLDGYFFYPRTVMGIENHLMGFYDCPELMHMMNSDLNEFNIGVTEEFLKRCKPDFMTFAEDMSYNNGSMISEDMFDEFISPYYSAIMPIFAKNDIPVVVDSDGDIKAMLPWFKRCGVSGFLPLEYQAGVDIVEMRKDHPELSFIGGYNKLIMHLGEEAMRAEFERIFPVMKQGGYIPSVDHQTPPSVSLENYKIYVKLLKEYCEKAAR